MSQLEELKKLYVKQKTYSIPKEPKEGQQQAKLIIYPLGLDELDLISFDTDMPIDKRKEQILKLFISSLKEDEETIHNIGLSYMNELLECILDANDLSISKEKEAEIKAIIEKRKQQLKDAKTE